MSAIVNVLEGQLTTLLQQNVADIQELNRRGIGFDQNQITNARIDTVINAIAQALGPQGEIWSLQCRLAFETAMAENVALAKKEGTKAQLAAGSSMSASNIRQLARQTGTFGG